MGVVIADLWQFLFRRQAGARDGYRASRAGLAGYANATGAVTGRPLLAAERSAAARRDHRLRPVGGDARRHRPSAQHPRRRSRQDECRGGDRRLQRCDAALSRCAAVRFRGGGRAGRAATARKDFAAARRLYDQAAAAGYAMAFNNIGIIYEGDEGELVNHVEAARWYQKAVDAGDPVAMINLAWLYEQGKGVKKDYAVGRRLYETSLKAGVSAAMNNLGLMNMKGEGGPRDYAEAQRLFEQGAALGNAACMNGLGVLYHDCNGLSRDLKVAHQWYEKAAALGDPQARQNLRGMNRKGQR